MKQILRLLFLALVVLALVGTSASASGGGTRGVKKAATDGFYAYIDINTILMWVANDGDPSIPTRESQASIGREGPPRQPCTRTALSGVAM